MTEKKNELLNTEFPQNEYLYHYTNKEALLSIVQNRSIWASHIAFQNDRLEFKYAFKIAQDEIKNTKSKMMSKQMDNFSNDLLKNISVADIYTVSFSEKKDILSQWRAYANSVPGFCISFRPKVLLSRIDNHSKFKFDYQGSDFTKKSKKNNSYNYKLDKCIYSTSEQRKIIREIIETSIDFTRTQGLQNTYAEIINRLLPWAPLLKHEKFEEEKEWRLIIFDIQNKQVKKERIGKSNFIPYVELDLKESNCNKNCRIKYCENKCCLNQDWIKEIVIGPCIDENTAKESTSIMCYNNGIEFNKESRRLLSISNIPYRNY